MSVDLLVWIAVGGAVLVVCIYGAFCVGNVQGYTEGLSDAGKLFYGKMSAEEIRAEEIRHGDGE